MIKGENRVAPYQFFFLIIQTEIGISILSLPYTVFALAKHDGWISMLLAGAITQLLILILWMLCKRFHRSSIFAIPGKIMGKWMGTVFLIAYYVYFSATASLILILFCRMLSIWVLPRTPHWVTMFLMVIAGVYITKENLRVLARFYVFVSVLIVILIAFIVYSFKDANYLYLLPIGQAGWQKILLGSKGATFSMLGFESLLVLYPLVKGTDSKKLKIASYANLFVTLFYVLIIMSCFLFFSPVELPLLPEPVLFMLKSFTFKILERIDLLFISIWVVTVATSFMTYLYMASTGLANLFGQRNHRRWVPIAALMIFIAALIPSQNELVIQKISDSYQPISMIFVVVLPLCLLLLSYLLRKKEVSSS